MNPHTPPWKDRRRRRRMEAGPELAALRREVAALTIARVSGPTFHPFDRLPRELRWDIWQLAISDTRRIMRIRSTPQISSRHPYPALANTCHEAREVCFKALKQLFPVFKRTANYLGGSPVLDPSKDLLLLSSHFTFSDLYFLRQKIGPENASMIRRLVKESSYYEIDRWQGRVGSGALTNAEATHKMFTWFPNLDHLTIILQENSPSMESQRDANGKLRFVDDRDMSREWVMSRYQRTIGKYQRAWMNHVRGVEKRTGVQFPKERTLKVDFKELVVIE